MRLFSVNFSSLAWFASSDVFVNVRLDSWPPVVARYEFACFVLAWVSSGCGIVMLFDNVSTKFRVGRNVNESFVSD